ncbi:hypothetical protein IF803_36205 [Bradyrhizobium sp. UFLA06-06]
MSEADGTAEREMAVDMIRNSAVGCHERGCNPHVSEITNQAYRTSGTSSVEASKSSKPAIGRLFSGTRL